MDLEKRKDFISFAGMEIARSKKFAMMSVKDAARINKISETYTRWLLKYGRIPNAFKIGTMWLIPETWKHKSTRKGRKHGPKPKPMLALKDPSLGEHNVSKTLLKDAEEKLNELNPNRNFDNTNK